MASMGAKGKSTRALERKLVDTDTDSPTRRRKVQEIDGSLYINIPLDTDEEVLIEKGDTLTLTIEDERIIIER